MTSTTSQTISSTRRKSIETIPPHRECWRCGSHLITRGHICASSTYFLVLAPVEHPGGDEEVGAAFAQALRGRPGRAPHSSHARRVAEGPEEHLSAIRESVQHQIQEPDLVLRCLAEWHELPEPHAAGAH
jgi:hypothetical protein